MLLTMTVVYLSLFSLMTGVWLAAVFFRNPVIADLFWAPAFFLAASIYIFWFDELDVRSFFILVVLATWVIRLTAQLYITRVAGRKQDLRYERWLGDFSTKKAVYFLNFQFQAILVFIISIPFYWISREFVPEFDLLDYTATVFCMMGIIGEAISDWQLNSFKKRFPHGVCTEGLWYYSRHPNYFFNWLMWCGFGVYSLSSGEYGFTGLISPVVVYWMFIKFGIPITEQLSLEHKGEVYWRYQVSTPPFFLNVFKSKE